MKRLFIVLLLVCLAGCGPEMTYEQQRQVMDACHAAGMKSKSQFNQVTCWTERP